MHGNQTRSQAVARIAGRTASQHLDSPCHFLLVVLWKGVSKSNRFPDIAI